MVDEIHYHPFRQYQCAYIDTNHDEPHQSETLIMLHNGMMDHRLFEKQIAFFRSTYRVIALDLLGYGASDRPNITYTTGLYIDQIVSLLDHLKIQQCHLIGCCIGGATAIELALQSPERITTVTAITLDAPEIIDAGILGKLSANTPFGSRRHEIGSRFMRCWLGRQCFKRFMKRHQMGDYYGKEPAWDKTFHRYFSDKNSIRSFCNLDVEDSQLRQAVKPRSFPKTLILWGEKNTILPVSVGKMWAHHFNADHLKTYSKSGYMLLREEAAVINQDILSFLTA